MEKIKVIIGERKYIIDNTLELDILIAKLEHISYMEKMKANTKDEKPCATD